jgi:hypothetical protein
VTPLWPTTSGKGLGVEFQPPFTAIGFTRDEKELCFGALYNCWNGSNIEMTVYGPKRWTGPSFAPSFAIRSGN